MARFTMYQFAPLPPVPGPDQADATQLASWTNNNLEDLEGPLGGAGDRVNGVLGLLGGAENQVKAAGDALTAAMDLFAAYDAEDKAIDLTADLAAALGFDSAISKL